MAEHIFTYQAGEESLDVLDAGDSVRVGIKDAFQDVFTLYSVIQLPELEIAKLHVALGVWLDQRELDRTLKPYEGKHRSETAA